MPLDRPEHSAELLLPCQALEPMLAFFDQLGFRVEKIFPADDPRVAVLGSAHHGLRLRCEVSTKALPEAPTCTAGVLAAATDATAPLLSSRALSSRSPSTASLATVEMLRASGGGSIRAREGVGGACLARTDAPGGLPGVAVSVGESPCECDESIPSSARNDPPG